MDVVMYRGQLEGQWKNYGAQARLARCCACTSRIPPTLGGGDVSCRCLKCEVTCCEICQGTGTIESMASIQVERRAGKLRLTAETAYIHRTCETVVHAK